MDYELIYSGKATLEDLYELNRLGYTFVIKAGRVTEIIEPQDKQ